MEFGLGGMGNLSELEKRWGSPLVLWKSVIPGGLRARSKAMNDGIG